MTTMAVDVEGVPAVEASVAAVVAVLQDPATAEAATYLVAAAARPLVPVATGYLAASERVTRTAAGASLVYGAPYAVIVQASQPWLGAGITAAVPELTALYDAQVLEAWNT
jgi:hypothetical protein